MTRQLERFDERGYLPLELLGLLCLGVVYQWRIVSPVDCLVDNRLSRRRTPLGYDREGDLESPGLSDDLPSELPEYDGIRRGHGGRPPPSQTVHSYTLNASRTDRPWLTLRVLSWVQNASSAPVFVESEAIAGHVDLDLDKPDSIKAIIITVRISAKPSNVQR